MFPLPKKLSSSLGFIGSDPKLAFRTQPTGIAKLAEKKNIAETDDAYWSQYVQLFDSASDVFTLITPQDIRKALSEAPENVSTLIKVITHRLFNLVIDHTFPSPMSASPIAMPKFASWNSSERDPTKEVLNCLRVLGRVLPVIFESDGPLEDEIFWTRPMPEPRDVDIHSAPDEPQFVIQEEDDDDDDFELSSGHANRISPPRSPNSKGKESEGKSDAQEQSPTLAERLFECTIDLLFCCGFTLPTTIQVEHHKINYVIWDKGIGSATSIGSNSQLDANKTEVLRFLLILLSRTIYHAPNQLLTLPNQYASHFVHKTPRRLVLSVLCSLLNTAMNGENGEGWSGVVDRVPYNHLILVRKGEEGRSGLIGLCLGLLCVLLDYQIEETPEASAGVAPTSATTQTNAFRYFISKLHRPSDFEFILNGILSTLESDLANATNLLPGSRKPVPYILETFVFLWRMIELNKKFRSYLLESDKLLDTIAYLLCFCLENKDKPQHHGLCRALSYIVQSLSAERRFGSQLQSPMPSRVSIPPKWITQGTAGDFLVSSIYSIVATTAGALNSLYPALVIAIANVAPYLKNLSVKTSTKLVHLFISFSNPTFLLADDGHPRLVFFVLEALNGILFHQLSSNPNVIYAILRSHRQFEELGTFTLAKSLREVRRMQQMKEERVNQLAAKKSGKDQKADVDASAEAHEKAMLLRRSLEDGLEALERSEQSGEATPAEGNEPPTSAPAHPRTPSTELGGPVSSRPTSPEDSAPEQGMSEKARGKMRERSVSLEGLDPELERVAAAGIGRNGFVPTQEWVTSWQQGLPLDPILLTISELLPKVTNMQSSLSRPTSSAVLEFLRSVTLQHVLPSAPPITPRRFQWSDASLVWLSSLIWGEVYVRGTGLGIWTGTNVRLFGVRHTPQPRGMGEAVQNVMGGLWGGSGGGGNITNPQSPTAGRVTPSRLNSR